MPPASSKIDARPSIPAMIMSGIADMKTAAMPISAARMVKAPAKAL